MALAPGRADPQDGPLKRFGETLRRSLSEFLRLPILIIAGFLLLAAGTSVLDFAEAYKLETIRAAMREHLFRNGEATSHLLATIAGSIITVTSITFSLLLLAVQQAAGALTHQVYDQFLRRSVNQVYFGFFVGLALYTLIVLASVNPPYNPVFGAALALLLTIVALPLTILLLYTTVNQMRPVVVIETIHDHVLRARECQRALLARTRRSTQQVNAHTTLVRATAHGYVVGIDIDVLAAAFGETRAGFEIALQVSIGTHVTVQDPLAEVRTSVARDTAKIAKRIQAAVCLGQQRNLDTDPAYGIEQLAIIGWTSVSTAKSNPSPGILVLQNLRDLMARWSAEEGAADPKDQDQAGEASVQQVPVVYRDDVFAKLFDAFETLAVVASESMQPQTMAEFVRTFALMFDRLPVEQRERANDLIRRALSALGEQVLTAQLDAALTDLVQALAAAGRHSTAGEVQAAQQSLRASIGKLGSRATRVSAAG